MATAALRLLLCAALLGCGRDASNDQNDVMHRSAAISRRVSPLASAELAADPAPPCADVAAHIAPMMAQLAGHADGGDFERQLDRHCESHWGGAMRACILQIAAPNGLMGCEHETKSTECTRAFDRLGKLAANAGKTDPELPARKDAFLDACATLTSAARKCLVEATRLDSFQACSNTEMVAHAVASDTLAWPAPPIPGLTSWHVERVESRMDDSSATVATRLAREKFEASGRELRPALVLRCADRALDLYVNVGVALEVDAKGNTDTRIRIDDSKAMAWKGQSSTSGDAVFLRDAKQLLGLLQGKRRMLFEFAPSQAPATNVEFELEGLDDVIPELSACGR